jgi:hypothetical protein
MAEKPSVLLIISFSDVTTTPNSAPSDSLNIIPKINKK